MNSGNSYAKKVCVCPNCFPGCEFEEVVRQSIRAGIHRVSLRAVENERNNLSSWKELLKRSRVEIPMAEVLIGERGSEQTARRAIDLCVELNVPLLNIAIAPPPETEDERRNARSLLRDCAQYADAAGIRLSLETYRGMTHDGAECLRTLDRVGEANLGINYDTGNVLRFTELSGAEMAEDLRLLAGYLRAMHLKDYCRKTSQIVIPGRGEMDLPAILRTLDEMNFSGVFGLDLEPSAAVTVEDHFLALQETLRNLKAL